MSRLIPHAHFSLVLCWLAAAWIKPALPFSLMRNALSPPTSPSATQPHSPLRRRVYLDASNRQWTVLSAQPPSAADASSADGGEGESMQLGKGDRVFDRVLSFPCEFEMRVIGIPVGPFSSDMKDIVEKVTGKEVVAVSVRDKGKYRSVRVTGSFDNADQLYEAYALFSKDKRVKFKF